MNDIDLELKRVFDQRLLRFVPPQPRQARPRRVRIAIAAAIIALLVSAAGGVLVDANALAAANGVDCADIFAKTLFWAQAKPIDPAVGPSKQEMDRILVQSGCVFVKGQPRTLEQPPAKGDVRQAPSDQLPTKQKP